MEFEPDKITRSIKMIDRQVIDLYMNKFTTY